MDHLKLEHISTLSNFLSEAIRTPPNAFSLIEAARSIVPFRAALCVINRKHFAPLYLEDTYQGIAEKEAVQRYIKTTYLLNPVYNAFLNGMESGVYRMRDLAPDHWHLSNESTQQNLSPDSEEEIGFLTTGWPAKLEELVMVSRLSDNTMVEISFAQPASLGGFTDATISTLHAFFPLFSIAMDTLAQHSLTTTDIETQPTQRRLENQLEKFANEQLTKRENQVTQLILKGHSGKSICVTLGISLPTLKSHRKNAYAKLGVKNQQELFGKFLDWGESLVDSTQHL
ncbi:hypothetical protein NBRC116583_02960 [Arenicella sp. 4NH20-0111]|uniref:helix-turn-helix transcriptional regulator n=1 Tax=Arenicella sp. 4NH20-0111 TaxID=3127648 RepID=UPI003104D621